MSKGEIDAMFIELCGEQWPQAWLENGRSIRNAKRRERYALNHPFRERAKRWVREYCRAKRKTDRVYREAQRARALRHYYAVKQDPAALAALRAAQRAARKRRKRRESRPATRAGSL